MKLRRFFARYPSLAAVVALTHVLVTTFVLGVYSVLTYVREARAQTAQLEALVRVHVHQTCVSLALPLSNRDEPQIERIIDAMTRPKSVYGLRVRAEGRTWIRMRNASWQMVPSERPLPADVRTSVAPVVLDGKRLGEVSLLVTTRFLENDLRALRIRLIATVLAVDVLLVVCTYLILARLVVEPIRAVKRIASDASSGGWPDASAPPPRIAELADLRHSIETMIRTLDARYLELRRSERMSAIGSIVAGVAHEVRNPLFGISATLEAFEAELGTSDAVAEYMTIVRRDVARLTHLMNDLLDYGRPHDLERHVQSIEPVIAEALRVCAAVAREMHVEVRHSIEGPIPEVAIDPDRMLQVLKNVLENAIEFSGAGGTVVLEVRAETGGVVITILDSGPGFREEDLPRLFEPFFTRRRGGSGLGLPIAQKIVTDHGGRIVAGNRPGGGARIEIRMGS